MKQFKKVELMELDHEVALRFTLLGPDCFTRQSVHVELGADPGVDHSPHSADALHGAVADNRDGTFTCVPPDGTHAQTDGVRIDPDVAVSGPFGIRDHPTLGLRHRERLFFYRVPADFIDVDSAEIHGARHGTVDGFEWIEVHQHPRTTVFGELAHGDRIGREFGLAPGTYVGFVYDPNDQRAAHDGPTTDTLTFTVHDGAGSIRYSTYFAISIPAVDIPAGVHWGPHSGPNTADGSIDVTRLDAFTGSTYLPTGEIVFEVSAADYENDDVTVTFTQPAHGTLMALRPRRITLPGRSRGDSGGEAVRLVYTPDARHRTDPTVHTDEFTIAVDDGRGGLTLTTVPVLIAKKAIIDVNAGLPYLGDESFTGRVDAPFDGVQGYLAVATALLSESVESLIDDPWSVGSTPFGAVTIDGAGFFTYTRDPDWADLPVDQIDDSFAVIAYTADNQWAAAVVPVGGKALTTYPSIIDLLESLTVLPGSVGS